MHYLVERARDTIQYRSPPLRQSARAQCADCRLRQSRTRDPPYGGHWRSELVRNAGQGSLKVSLAVNRFAIRRILRFTTSAT